MSSILKILSGGAMRPLLAKAVPLFEAANGVKVELRYALTSVLAKEIEAGAPFDLALMPRPELETLLAGGKIAPGIADIARSTVGLMVRAGAPKPDIGSVAALKAALLQAATLGYSDGPSGAYVAGLLDRLGIAGAMQAKTRLTSAPVAELVARGEAEIGIQQIVAILPVRGADLVGPLPAELQNVITYAAGLSARAAEPETGRGFVKFMARPEAAAIMRAVGLEPG